MNHFWKEVWDWVYSIIVALALAMLIHIFIFVPTRVAPLRTNRHHRQPYAAAARLGRRFRGACVQLHVACGFLVRGELHLG